MTPRPVAPLLHAFVGPFSWVDRVWLEGNASLERNVSLLLARQAALGAPVHLCGEVVALERLASDAPGTFAELRTAVESGRLVLGAAGYGLPQGLFHGGESNVRQRLLGLRALRRLFGSWPRFAWSGAWEFFPQLPQLLAGCGSSSAVFLMHPSEAGGPAASGSGAEFTWEGLDGSRLAALRLRPTTRAELERGIAALTSGAEPAGLALWLDDEELEAAHAPFAGLPEGTAGLDLSRCIDPAAASERTPLRYVLDDLDHGANPAKNAGFVVRASRAAEEQLLHAESAAALAGLLGRPYPSFDVYPHWELDEAWRRVCTAQHQDVLAREGLCGAIGERFLEFGQGLGAEIFGRSLDTLADRVDAPEGTTLVYNALGWPRDMTLAPEAGGGVVRDVPAHGYRVVDPYDALDPRLGAVDMRSDESVLAFERRDLRVEIDRGSGLVSQVWSDAFPDGLLHPERPLGRFEMLREGLSETFAGASFLGDGESDEWAEYAFERSGAQGAKLRVTYGVAPLHGALWMRIAGEELPRPDAGLAAGLATIIEPQLEPCELLHDHPFGITGVDARRDRLRALPAGTGGAASETLRRPFSSLGLVDLCEGDADGRGLLVVHAGSQSWGRSERGARCTLSARDPWDSDYFDGTFDLELFFLPHGKLSNTERARTAMELTLGSPHFSDWVTVRPGGDLPPVFGALAVDAANVLCTAFHRVSARDALDLERHFSSGEGARDPYVLRLVEFDGRPAEVLVRVPGPVARAARTNLLGEVEEELEVSATRAAAGPAEVPWSALRLALRPHEVATVMLDLELGRLTPPQPAPAAAARTRSG